MEGYWLISEAAREVEVESHVLRYWEEELKLPIKRNEQGHRYYTREDVEFFKQIKGMKEKGLQLKAIKMIMKNGDLDVLPDQAEITGMSPCDDHTEVERKGKTQIQTQVQAHMQTEAVADSSLQENKEEKTQRLHWLLQQLIREAVRENNRELCQEIKESVVKELDYQFRNLEEREEQRDALREQREEEHFRKLDELLRKKARRDRTSKDKAARDKTAREVAREDEEPIGRNGKEVMQVAEKPKDKHSGLFKINKLK